MAKASRPDDLVLVLQRRDSDYEFSHLYSAVCYRNQGRSSSHDFDAVLSPVFDSSFEPYPHYAGLRASCQLNRRDNDRRAYAERVEFDVQSVELARAESMAKTLRLIAKRMEALRQQWGYPRGFADFVARFADVLGVPRFATYSEERRIDGACWRWLDVDQMRQWVAEQESL